MATEEIVWRDDRLTTDRPDNGSLGIRSKDHVRAEGIFCLVIHHVESVRGRGFMPSILYGPNGEVHLGTGKVAYGLALAEGAQMLWREIEDVKQKYGLS